MTEDRIQQAVDSRQQGEAGMGRDGGGEEKPEGIGHGYTRH